MGSQQPGFSLGLRHAIEREIGEKATRMVWREVYWADVLQPREAELWSWMLEAREPDGTPVPLDWRVFREFVVHNFGDAIAYHRDLTACTYDDVHRRIDAGVKGLTAALDNPAAPVVVLAHSLGGHMMSNYLWDRQAAERDASADPFAPIPTLIGMVTFGCNIPLFSLSYEQATPVDVPGSGVTDQLLKRAARWMNFVDRDDVLGWPVKPLYQKNYASLNARQRATVDLITEHEINAGSPLVAWNPASHSSYWSDSSFVQPVGAYLAGLIALLAPQVENP
jgi:hypothetical protein